MLKIGDFSKLSRLSIRMLRHYDELGLLVPESTDDVTGYRYYSEEQLTVAGRICALKEMGFGLAAIIEMLRHFDEPAILAEYLTARRREVQAEADQIRRRLLLLDNAIERLRKDDSAMDYNVTVKTIPQRYVASVRKKIPAYNEEGILWQIMMSETARMNLQCADGYHTIAIFHDKEHKETDVDVEIQYAVKGNYENTEHVIFKTMPPVEVASATYKGSYDYIGKVNQAVANWVKENGYEFSDAMFCIYHVSPAETQNPDELVTEVCFPVKKM